MGDLYQLTAPLGAPAPASAAPPTPGRPARIPLPRKADGRRSGRAPACLWPRLLGPGQRAAPSLPAGNKRSGW